jgi:myosin-3
MKGDPTKFLMVGGVDNLANLAELSEATLLSEMKSRFMAHNIMTYVGDILVVMNPYQRYPIYTPEIQKFYMGEQFGKDDLAPHAYRLADVAYQRITSTGNAQTFVISGESGAGKTETTKIIVSHIMALCKAGKTDLEEKIKQLNPFLEAFGNAKTKMNNNSSRFGKYLELKFDTMGNICGAAMLHYLLEKSRVCFRNEGEQSFHIFYQLYSGMAASNNLGDYGFATPSGHRYLNTPPGPPDDAVLGSTMKTCGEGDGGLAEEWTECVDGMKFIKISDEHISSMAKLLACSILIGDITFEEGGNDDAQVTGGPLAKICEMYGFAEDVLKAALTTSSTVTRGEKITKNLNKETAISYSDAVAKGVFSKIFDWIFETSNKVLIDPKAPSDIVTIGVLDIFGFEVFAKNSIEQMCIDLTNEQLQGYFNNHVFVAEQEEYKTEGVDVSKISFSDNQSTLDMFLSKKGSIFAILDEETRFPKASDLTFTQKCSAALASHPSKAFTAPRSDRDTKFTVEHYAGPVEYFTLNFLEKNRDSLSLDIKDMLASATDPLMKILYDPAHPSNAVVKKAPTLASIFKASLADLMDRMGKCEPQFVRCLKATPNKKPLEWDEDLVTRQLKYAGVLETIKIRKLGYSFRMEFAGFVKKYKNITYHYHEAVAEDQASCQKLLGSLKKEDGSPLIDDFQVGTTKVFMKYYHGDLLAAEARKHAQALLFLQNIVKGHVARELYQVKLVEARKTREECVRFLREAEKQGATYGAKMKVIADFDASQTDRPWMGKLMEQAQNAEAEAIEIEEQRKEELAAVQDEPKEEKTTVVNGYMVWQQNEHLDLKVGPLERPWRKKVDEATGRTYFKNTETKTTTWVDPRSHTSRPHDPAECSGDELPFGWDKAETETGVVFYINHLLNEHHKDHPRDQLIAKQQKLAKLESANVEKEAPILAVVNELKEKRTLLTVQLGEASDEQARGQVEARIADLTKTIDKNTAVLHKQRNGIDALKQQIERMKSTKPLDLIIPSH